YVWARRDFTRADRLAFSHGRAYSTNADYCVDDYFFHRVSGGELGVPNRERNFSAGNPRGGNRNFLRNRNPGGRRRCASTLRMDHRHRIDYRIVRRIFGGCGIMIFGAAIEAWIGVPAERRSLEHVAAPLSSKGL